MQLFTITHSPGLKAGLGNVQFEDIVHNSEGDVPVRILGSTKEHGTNILGGLLVGASYTPGSHPYPVKVIVLEGSGFFHLNGGEHVYTSGSVFYIQANVKHAFVRVASPTLFIKHADDVSVHQD